MPPDPAPPVATEYDGWATLKRFLPYLWPRDRTDLRIRIAGALVLVLLAKAVTLATPLAMKKVVDTMAAQGNPLLWVALSFVIAFAYFEQTFYRYAKRYEQDAAWALPSQPPLGRLAKSD